MAHAVSSRFSEDLQDKGLVWGINAGLAQGWGTGMQVHTFDHIVPHAEMRLLEFVCGLISIHEINGRSPIAHGLPEGAPSKGCGCNEKALMQRMPGLRSFCVYSFENGDLQSAMRVFALAGR